MFGTLHPHGCHLSESQKQNHQRFYCGLCKTLGSEFGLLQRGMLSFDAVFMGLVGDGLMQEAAPESECRCPMMPVIHRPTISDKSPAMRYAAAVGMLLADQWLADRAVDGKASARIARPLLNGSVKQAHQILEELGVSLEELDGFEQTQLECEVQGVTTPTQAAAPTAYALGVVFSQIADLPGVVEASQTPEAREELRQLGAAIGEVIYLTDALEDLKDDFVEGAFNPCLSIDRSGTLAISQARVNETSEQLKAAIAQLQTLLDQLPWQRHRDLLDNILGDQFGRAAKKAIEDANKWCQTEAVMSLLAWKQRHPIDRASTQFFVALAAMWASIISMVTAFAKSASTGPPGGKAGPAFAKFSDPSSPLTPERIDGGGGGGNSLCCIQQCGDSCSGCTKNFCQCNCLGDWIKQCGDGFSNCGKSCGKSCDCTNTCNNWCSECGKSCKPDKGCESCTKCDCTKSCEGCGKCDCNNACQGCGKGCECTKVCESCGKSGSSYDLPPGGCC